MLIINLFKLLIILTLTLLINGQKVDAINQNATTATFRTLHQRKCHQYQQLVYRYVFTVGLAIGDDPKKVRIDLCGHNTVPLIVNGEDAKLGEFPHMAIIGYERQSDPNQINCAGSLISERFVLTAAHCLNSRTIGNPSFVRLGELDVIKSNPYTQRIPIEQIIPHFLYKPEEKYHDIALLKLSRDAVLNSHVIPACLPLSLENPESRYISTGWTVVELGKKTSSTRLQRLGLDKYSDEECKNFYLQARSPNFSHGIRVENQHCAGSRTSQTKDICEGGGPLQLYHPDEYCMFIVAGVSSFGYKCGLGVPGVYTRVAYYIFWIEQIIWPTES